MPIADIGFDRQSDNEERDTPSSILSYFGPTVLVEIGFEPNLLEADVNELNLNVLKLREKQSLPPEKYVNALLDTGASHCCIDESLAKELNLPLVDQQTAAGVGGSHTFNSYLAYIKIPDLGNHVHRGKFMGVHLLSGGQPHAVLLGRDILEGMVMVYDGRKGSVTLSF